MTSRINHAGLVATKSGAHWVLYNAHGIFKGYAKQVARDEWWHFYDAYGLDNGLHCMDARTLRELMASIAMRQALIRQIIAADRVASVTVH